MRQTMIRAVLPAVAIAAQTKSTASVIVALDAMDVEIKNELKKMAEDKITETQNCNVRISTQETVLEKEQEAMAKDNAAKARMEESIESKTQQVTDAKATAGTAEMDLQAKKKECKADVAALQAQAKTLYDAIQVSYQAQDLVKSTLHATAASGAALLQRNGKSITREEFVSAALDAIELVVQSEATQELARETKALLQQDGEGETAAWLPRKLKSLTGSASSVSERLGKIIQDAEKEHNAVEKTLASTKKGCAVAKTSLQGTIENANEKAEMLGGQITEDRTSLTEVTDSISALEKSIAATEAALGAVKDECSMWLNPKEFNALVQTLTDQVNGIDMIKAALTNTAPKNVSSFVQTRSAHKGKETEASEESEAAESQNMLQRSKAAFVIEDAARKSKSFVLFQASQALRGKTPFGKVTEMIEKLVLELETTMSKAGTVQERCVDEQKDADKELARARKGTAQLKKRLSDANAEASELQGEVPAAEEAASDAQKALADYQAGYQAKLNTLQGVIKTLDDSLASFGQALSLVLGLKADAESERKATAFGTIETMLKTQLGDDEAENAQTKAELQQLKDSYAGDLVKFNTNQQTSAAYRNTLNMKLAGVQKRVITLKDDVAAAEAEEAAALEASEANKTACSSTSLTYEELQEQRQRQIDALKDALQILQSSSFVQKKMSPEDQSSDEKEKKQEPEEEDPEKDQEEACIKPCKKCTKDCRNKETTKDQEEACIKPCKKCTKHCRRKYSFLANN